MSRLAMIALCLSVLACAPPESPRTAYDELPNPPAVGARVEVQLRRDALGAAGENPVPPTTSVHNGAATSITGELLGITAEWVGVRENDRQHWVNRDAVLLITIRSGQ